MTKTLVLTPSFLTARRTNLSAPEDAAFETWNDYFLGTKVSQV